jgi:hypothetical protein
MKIKFISKFTNLDILNEEALLRIKNNKALDFPSPLNCKMTCFEGNVNLGIITSEEDVKFYKDMFCPNSDLTFDCDSNC